MLANASSMEQRPPPSSAPDCDCSWRIRRPVACRCGGGVSSLFRGTVARRFGSAGAGRRTQSKGKRQKTGLEKACQACVAACTPRHLSLPSFPSLLANPCLPLRAVLCGWLDARVRVGCRRACECKGGECLNMNNLIMTHLTHTRRAIWTAFLPILSVRDSRQHRM